MKLNKLLIIEYQDFLKEVLRKLVRAEIDREVFSIRRNEQDREESDRNEQSKLYLSSAESVDDFKQIVGIIIERIEELKKEDKNNGK